MIVLRHLNLPCSNLIIQPSVSWRESYRITNGPFFSFLDIESVFVAENDNPHVMLDAKLFQSNIPF